MEYDRKRTGVLKLVLEDIAEEISKKVFEPVSVSETDSFEPFLDKNNGPYYVLTREVRDFETMHKRYMLFFRRIVSRRVEKQDFVMAVSQRLDYEAERETMFIHVYSRGTLSEDTKEYLREYGNEFGIEGIRYRVFK